jgi:hypothetical protein
LALHAFGMFLGQAIGVAVAGLVIRAIGYDGTFLLSGLGLVLLGRRFALQIRAHRRA